MCPKDIELSNFLTQVQEQLHAETPTDTGYADLYVRLKIEISHWHTIHTMIRYHTAFCSLVALVMRDPGSGTLASGSLGIVMYNGHTPSRCDEN